jgi:hypothetical protein
MNEFYAMNSIIKIDLMKHEPKKPIHEKILEEVKKDLKNIGIK